MQSFSAKTKSELCRLHLAGDCCRLAELYGMLLFTPTFGNRVIRLASEQHVQARRAAMLFEQALHITVKPTQIGKKWVVEITEERDLRTVLQALGYDFKSHLVYHLNRNVVENECCMTAFLRGAFITSGTLAGPDKKAHLELTTTHVTLCREMISLMLDHGFNPKTTERRCAYMIYWKDSATIEHFLAKIGAHRAMTALLEGKIERQVRGEINRQVNCETANYSRVADASARQIAAIEQALSLGGIDIFPEKLHQTVDLRVAHPTASLAELATYFHPPISKPGLSHRLRKIVEIAQQVIENSAG